MCLKIGYVYDAGGRSLNEDALLYRESLFRSGSLVFAAVCDGMGGMDEGAYASTLCINELEDFYDHILIPFISETTEEGYRFEKALDNRLITVFKKINDKLFLKMRESKIRAGSTLSVCVLFKDVYRIYHIGDSRIYRLIALPFYGTYFIKKTKDDVQNCKLTRCVGLNRDHRPQIKRGHIHSGAILLCSDGFYKKGDKHLIKSALSLSYINNNTAINKRLKAISEEVKKRGEKDNITALMIVVKKEVKTWTRYMKQ